MKPSSRVVSTCGHSATAGLSIATLAPGSSAPNSDPSENATADEKYLKEGFPSPQLEVNERTELNDELLREEQTLSTYDYVDKNAGTVRIPIDRAMELVAQRGLPTRTQASDLIAVSVAKAKTKEANKK